MGKILQYLGVSEEGQNRDILDAERLLEGMQMIYSQSPDGSKKDSFSVPLAEMTKIFIEKVKGIEPTPTPEPEVQEELPFKEGDKYISSGDTVIYTIKKIKDETIDIGWKNQFNNQKETFLNAYSIEDAKKNFETGYWTLVKDEELPFKVGDRFIEKASPNIILTITKIEDERIDLEWVKQNGNIEEFQNACTLYEAKANFEKGDWILIKDEELPFKVGDKFLRTYNLDDILTIEKIEDNIVTVSYINITNKKEDTYYTLDFVKEKFASGEWFLIKDEEFPYKVDDKFKVQDTIERFAIININEDTVEIAFVIGDGTIDLYNLTKEEFLENVSLGRYIKITDEEFSPKPQPESKPQKPKRTRKPKEETEQDKQIREILEINLDDIDL